MPVRRMEQSYRTFLDFTKSTDSNSTGYSGNLIAAHGNLYTLYQDNNDEFAVKLGISTDGGDTWHINRLAPSTGGALALAVDPKDPDLVYVAAFNKAGLTVLRIPDATSTSVTPWPVHGDGKPETGHEFRWRTVEYRLSQRTERSPWCSLNPDHRVRTAC